MRIERTTQSGRYVVELLFSAHTYAFICSPYISQEYAWEMVKLAKRGVLVKVLTSDKIIEKDFYIRSFFAEVKRQDRLDKLITLVMSHRGQSFEHSKMYVVDDQFAVAGSANLTRPGMWQNSETIYISETLAEVQRAKEVFESAWKDALTLAFGSDNTGSPNNNFKQGHGRHSDYHAEQRVKVAKKINKNHISDAIAKRIKESMAL